MWGSMTRKPAIASWSEISLVPVVFFKGADEYKYASEPWMELWFRRVMDEARCSVAWDVTSSFPPEGMGKSRRAREVAVTLA